MALRDLPEWKVEGAEPPGRVSVSPPREPLLAPIDPGVRPDQVEVVIVGGGPSGLTAAILLAQRGIDVLLLERRNFIGHFPRAHLLNVRTMEIFDEMGVADDIYAISPPEEDWHKVVWVTSFDGPTELHGLKIGEVPAWGGGTDADLYAKASPRRFANVSQIRLDRLLWEHADAACPGRIRGMQEVTSVTYDADGALVRVSDRTSGDTYAVRSRYVIGADGGRVIAGSLGIELEGARSLLDQVSFYLSADFSKWAHEGTLLHKLVRPEGKGGLAGNLLALGPDTWGRFSKDWTLSLMRRDDEPRDDAALLSHMLELWGIPTDHPVRLRAVSHWQYEGVVAQRFRSGPVFLVGDAAHRHPPAGGLGLNLGVQDSYNLSWKLAAVLRGQAEESLLETYESERRPVAAHFVAHALENAARNFGIAAGLGMRPGQTLEEGWAGIALWASDTPAGEKARAVVADAVAANAEDYSQLNVEAGYSYDFGALFPDGTPPPEHHESAIIYTPSARPGHQLPHVWVEGPEGTVSTRNLVSRAGFTVFVGPTEARRWQEAVSLAAKDAGIPVELVVIGDGGYRDPVGEWAAISGTGASGAILVRPDRFVAWRTTTVDGAETQLAGIVAAILAGKSPTGDAAPRYLKRLFAAADSIKSTRLLSEPES